MKITKERRKELENSKEKRREQAEAAVNDMLSWLNRFAELESGDISPHNQERLYEIVEQYIQDNL